MTPNLKFPAEVKSSFQNLIIEVTPRQNVLAFFPSRFQKQNSQVWLILGKNYYRITKMRQKSFVKAFHELIWLCLPMWFLLKEQQNSLPNSKSKSWILEIVSKCRIPIDFNQPNELVWELLLKLTLFTMWVLIINLLLLNLDTLKCKNIPPKENILK